MRGVGWVGRNLLDFALPARCPACGTITDQLHSFCAPCWQKIDWLGEGGCESCGVPLEATDIEQCARCLARPPIILRTRAAMAYGDIARTLVLKLKYSRKVALARTMAKMMQPMIRSLKSADAAIMIVPVPLHWSRLWWRGFNQAGLIAAELARLGGTRFRPELLHRVRRTRPLKQMSPRQRSNEVRAAFAVADPAQVEGRHCLLVDDVLTSGSTSDACAKALLRAGANQVDLICFARVVRPALLDR